MRLTLRTMLAWLDNVLEPADAELLGKKIGESTFATELTDRIRKVAKKVRMNAPKLDGKGMGSDANTVSEYLDSALPQDRVGDFERVCLESDAHLAEVACCHQILTLVLGKAADVPIELRDRVYALGTTEKTAAKPAAAAGATAAAATATAPAAGDAKPTPAVPDYLREGRKSNLGVLVGVLAATFLLVAVGLHLMGPFDGSHPLAQIFGGDQPVAVNPLPQPAPPSPPQPVPTPPTPVDPAVPTPDETPMPMPIPAPPEEAVVPAPMPTPVPPVVPAPPETPETVKPTPTPPVDPAPKPPIVAEPPLPGVDVGRYVSDEQVMAFLTKADGLWMRLAPRAILTSGTRLVALPTFRPQIALASGVQITFAGDSSIVLEQPGESGASQMTIEYGRLTVVTAGGAGAQVELNLAGVQGLVTLVDADSGLAIHVKRYLAPGADPSLTPPIPVIEIFTTGGRVAWHEAGQERVDIPPQHVRVYVGADPPETLGPFAAPEWIDAKSIRPVDRDASLKLEGVLNPDRPLNLTLMEKTLDRQVEVRALAARCLASLDEFDPVLKELADSRQYSYWAGEFAALRNALCRSEDSAAVLLATIERLRPADLAELKQLILGYSPEQLAEKGDAAQLVKLLEHEQMDVRVLAFQNLISITGAMEFYLPAKKPEDQKPAIANWKDRAAKGTIMYKSPPSPLEAYKPLEATAPRPTSVPDPGL